MDPSQENFDQLVNQILKEANLNITFKDIIADPILDRSLGCMFGSIIGDSLGSYIEFQPQPDKQKMEELMKMPGGGTFPIQPGQGTDDTEMSLCLLHSLLHYQTELPLSEQSIGLYLVIVHSYIAWMQSNPFDIGQTTQIGLQVASSLLQGMETSSMSPSQLNDMRKTILLSVGEINGYSKSNGYLMRNHPLAILKAYLRKYKIPQSLQIKQLIKYEFQITHVNDQCLQSAEQFIDAIAALIARPNFAAVKEIYERWTQKKSLTWEWKTVVMQEKWMPTTEKIGWAKIAYTQAFNWLRQISDRYFNDNQLSEKIFEQVMRNTIQKGGDTDTNAAIVGSMTGAIFGFSRLPKKYLTKVLQLRMPIEQFEKQDRQKTSRTPFFEPRNALINVIKLRNKFVKE